MDEQQLTDLNSDLETLALCRAILPECLSAIRNALLMIEQRSFMVDGESALLLGPRLMGLIPKIRVLIGGPAIETAGSLEASPEEAQEYSIARD